MFINSQIINMNKTYKSELKVSQIPRKNKNF